MYKETNTVSNGKIVDYTQAENKMEDLFGSPQQAAAPKEKQKGNYTAETLHTSLIALYGKTEGEKCKSCGHFTRYGVSYFKCALTNKKSGNPATDWRANWTACGKFESLT